MASAAGMRLKVGDVFGHLTASARIDARHGLAEQLLPWLRRSLAVPDWVSTRSNDMYNMQREMTLIAACCSNGNLISETTGMSCGFVLSCVFCGVGRHRFH